MNRRNFLSSLLAASTLDPERLLWVPGAKMTSVPKAKIRLMTYSAWHRTGHELGIGRSGQIQGFCLENEMPVVRHLYRDARFDVLYYEGNERRYEIMRGMTRTIYDPRVFPKSSAVLHRIG